MREMKNIEREIYELWFLISQNGQPCNQEDKASSYRGDNFVSLATKQTRGSSLYTRVWRENKCDTAT